MHCDYMESASNTLVFTKKKNFPLVILLHKQIHLGENVHMKIVGFRMF